MAINYDSPFMNELREEATKLEHGEQILTVNGTPMGRAIWNLIVSKRDLTLWCNLGMKPTRSWKVTDVKTYFGVAGTGEILLERFNELYASVMGEQ